MSNSKVIRQVISLLCAYLLIFLQIFAIISSCTAMAAENNEDSIPKNLLYILENELDGKKSSEEICKAVKKEDAEFTLSLKNDDGSFTAHTFGVPIRYHDESGECHFVDTAFVPTAKTTSESTQYDYTNKSNDFHVEFSVDARIGMNFDDAFTMSVAEISERTAKKGVVDFDENKDGRITYPSVFGNDIDVEYINTNRGIKENIILRKNTGKNTFSYHWTSETYHPVLSWDKRTIGIVSNTTGEILYQFQNMLMYDSYRLSDNNNDESSKEKHFSEDCFYNLTQTAKNAYIITVTVSEDFLNAPQTVYPVIVDPSVIATNTASNIQDTFVSEGTPNTNYGSNTYMRIGYYPYHISTPHKMFSFIKFNNLPSVNLNTYRITTATLKIFLCSGTTTAPQTSLATVTGTWSENGLTWNNKPNGCSPFCRANAKDNCSYYMYEATEIVKKWYHCNNIGANIAYTNETTYDFNLLSSSDGAVAYSPYLIVYYANANKKTYVNSYQANANNAYNEETSSDFALTYCNNNNFWFDSIGVEDTTGYLRVKTAQSNYGFLNDHNCTNFVSACLHEGGMIYLGQTGSTALTSWNYHSLPNTLFDNYNATPTWGRAESFSKHWGVSDITSSSGIPTRAYREIVYMSADDVMNDIDFLIYNLSKGDVIQLCSTEEGIHHSMIITNIDIINKDIKYCQHTPNGPENSFYDKYSNNAYGTEKIIFFDMK